MAAAESSVERLMRHRAELLGQIELMEAGKITTIEQRDSATLDNGRDAG
jgi:hypothetical protein